MFEKGLIISIQGYSLNTTQELVDLVIKEGAVGIRTDQPIKCNIPIIGLKKLKELKYYITTTREAINEVSAWTRIIAIDSRKGNANIDLLYAHCHLNEINVIADIENHEDVINILTICEEQRIKTPIYFATTFSDCNIDLIKQIKSITNISIIAEGGFNTEEKIIKAKNAGVNNICIGTAISDIKKLTEKFIKYYKGDV
jgi:putative N-acetylmannosamine-6-phosphate epimerase